MTATMHIKSPNQLNSFGGTETAADFLDVNGVSKSFGDTLVLDDVSLQVQRGEFVCILGPSGCGKTTLLRIIAGLENSDCGTVHIAGSNMTHTPTAGRGIGIVFQSYALFPNLTALQNVMFGLRRYSEGRRAAREKAMLLLDTVGLADSAGKYPAQLSGGQQQRVALARALAPEPSILLLDEPLSALDAKVRLSLRKEIRRLQQKLRITAIMVTHDQEEALTMSDRVVVMSRGRLAQFASPEEIYHLPSSPFVADFIGAMNFLEGWRLSSGVAKWGGVTMRVHPGTTESAASATLAIRPEDILVRQDGLFDENALVAKITDMEFRGSGYSLSLLVLAQGSNDRLTLEALVPPLQVARMALKVGDCISVKLPRERLVCFSDSGGNAPTSGQTLGDAI